MIKDEVEKLELENRLLRDNLHDLEVEHEATMAAAEIYLKFISHTVPVKVYRCERRRNTTVIFEDGSSTTVKRKSGEKDCIETAIAYAIMKHLFEPQFINKLIKEKEEK